MMTEKEKVLIQRAAYIQGLVDSEYELTDAERRAKVKYPLPQRPRVVTIGSPETRYRLVDGDVIQFENGVDKWATSCISLEGLRGAFGLSRQEPEFLITYLRGITDLIENPTEEDV